ncbi:beta-lactamase domain-containing protein 2 [Aplysia californica]|uniref:Beta-lactamase domain-containing protein 2 n=1 Tax=Aplysia californica TaxID=6500 RepID=A0ABM0K5K9_APLCA|nr:beta-lactamase domain-containing protein 2 [Aplysia californica]
MLQYCGKHESILKSNETKAGSLLMQALGLTIPRMSWLLRAAPALVLLAISWRAITSGIFPKEKVPYGGQVHPAFQEVKEIFEKNVQSGREPGASFAVYRHGKPLVDLWGGYADVESKKPWQQGTLSQLWSSTKGVAAVVVGMLADRGFIDYQRKVSDYWPEFAANGKEDVTVAMLLSHQAGLMHLSRGLTLYDYRDQWELVEELMAKQEPMWLPGTRFSYHAFTYGMYVDALVRKVDPLHRNISQFFKEEVADPFDLDLHIGLPFNQFYRSTRAEYVSLLSIFISKFALQPGLWKWLPDVFFGGFLAKSLEVFDFMNNMYVMNDAELRSIGLASAVGFGNARSLAKLYDFLSNNGTVQGKRLLSKDHVKSLSTPVTEKIEVIAFPDRPFAMGTIVDNNPLGQTIFGHRGYGGQNGYADPTHGVGVSYVTNFNSIYSDCDDPRATDLLQALYRCLQRYQQLPEDEK